MDSAMTPSFASAVRFGVRPLSRYSGRNPSMDIRMSVSSNAVDSGGGGVEGGVCCAGLAPTQAPFEISKRTKQKNDAFFILLCDVLKCNKNCFIFRSHLRLKTPRVRGQAHDRQGSLNGY